MLSRVLVNYRGIDKKNKGREKGKRKKEKKQTKEGKTEGTCESESGLFLGLHLSSFA